MRLSRALSTAVAALLLLSACSNGNEEDPPPIPNDENDEAIDLDDDGNEDEQDTEIDVSTVPSNPDDIDEEYLQAVMDELNPIIQAAVVVFREVGDATDPNVREIMLSAYTERSGQAQLETLAGFGVESMSDEPGAPTAAVEQIFESQEDCIVFSAERTWRPVLASDVEYDPVQPYYLRLVPNEPTEVNPTAWQLDFDGYFDDPDVELGDDVCDV